MIIIATNDSRLTQFAIIIEKSLIVCPYAAGGM